MAYEYIVVWYTKAKSWFSGERRPLECNARPFRSLEKAEEFTNKFIPKGKIYRYYNGRR